MHASQLPLAAVAYQTRSGGSVRPLEHFLMDDSTRVDSAANRLAWAFVAALVILGVSLL